MILISENAASVKDRYARKISAASVKTAWSGNKVQRLSKVGRHGHSVQIRADLAGIQDQVVVEDLLDL